MPGIGDILAGKSAQIADIFMYSVFGEVVKSLLQPYLESVSEDVWEGHPILPLDPAQLAQMVLRGWMEESAAADEAKLSGLNEERFAKLWRSNGLPIAPQQAAEALRRKFIPEDSGSPDTPSYINAIRQGDLRDIWGPVVKQLATLLPSPVDAINSDVRGELDKSTAQDYYNRFGGDPEYYEMLFNLAGTPISPEQAGRLANRGIISWHGVGPEETSFEQAIRESHTKNKWEPLLEKLQEYVPPPRTITTLIVEGAISKEKAQELYQANGMTAELAAIYTQGATNGKVAKHKDLAETTVLSLYSDQLISRADAAGMIEKLGFDATEAEFILDVQDAKREQQQVNAIVSKLRSLFISRKISESQVLGALGSLKLASESISKLMTIWKLEYQANVRIPTTAEILSAWQYKILDQSGAQAELEFLGYSAHDAWLLLSIKNKGALPNEPAKTVIHTP